MMPTLNLYWETGRPSIPGLAVTPTDVNEPARVIVTSTGMDVRVSVVNVARVDMDMTTLATALGYTQADAEMLLGMLPVLSNYFSIDVEGVGEIHLSVLLPAAWSVVGFLLDGVPIQPMNVGGRWEFDVHLSVRTLTVVMEQTPIQAQQATMLDTFNTIQSVMLMVMMFGYMMAITKEMTRERR